MFGVTDDSSSPRRICLPSISQWCEIERIGGDRMPAAGLNKRWNLISCLRLAIESRDPEERRQSVGVRTARWVGGKGKKKREIGLTISRLCLATARYLECQCNAVGWYVINASCRCYRRRGRYAKVVRVTTGNVRSCCAVMEYYYRSTSRDSRRGLELSNGADGGPANATRSMVHDDARFSSLRSVQPARRRFHNPWVMHSSGHDATREIFLAKLHGKDVPVYLRHFYGSR